VFLEQQKKQRRKKMTETTHGKYLRLAVVAVIAAMLVALWGAKPAEAAFAGFPEGHGTITFEKDGDIWVASLMHLANLTPSTADSDEVDPAVSPDGREVAFASDRDGHDFEIYVADVFTGEVQQVTDDAVDDRNPAWSHDGQTITPR
jgi:dipeptidyl aminopeptidase/acylaminoacyl peptidase